MAEGKNELTGGCHCGKLKVSFHSVCPPEDFDPRACDCDFCMCHGATYVSDPAGRMVVDVQQEDALGRYRQGSDTAEFLFCRECGVLVGVTVERDAGMLGAVNVACLDQRERFGEPKAVSPRQLARETKIARWEEVWTRDVVVRVRYDRVP